MGGPCLSARQLPLLSKISYDSASPPHSPHALPRQHTTTTPPHHPYDPNPQQVLGFIISAIMQTYSKRYLDGHMWLRCSHQGPMVRGVCLRMKVYCAYVRTRQMVWPWWSRPQGFWEVALAVLPRLPWAGRKKVNVFFFSLFVPKHIGKISPSFSLPLELNGGIAKIATPESHSGPNALRQKYFRVSETCHYWIHT